MSFGVKINFPCCDDLSSINKSRMRQSETTDRTTHLDFYVNESRCCRSFFLLLTPKILLFLSVFFRARSQLNQQNPKGATTTQDYSFLKEASPIYVTSLSNSNNSTVTSAAISTAKISNPPAKSPTVKSFSNPLGESFGNNQHPELHQTNSTSNQLLTTSIIRKPITSSTFDNKSVQNNINYIASAANPSSALQPQQLQQLILSKQVAGPSTAQGTLTAIPLYDPSSDLIKNSASNVVVNNNNSSNFHNNINVLNNASGNQLPNLDFDPIDGCTSYYSNNRTNEVLTSHVPLRPLKSVIHSSDKDDKKAEIYV